jgi:hypothetical protein
VTILGLPPYAVFHRRLEPPRTQGVRYLIRSPRPGESTILISPMFPCSSKETDANRAAEIHQPGPSEYFRSNFLSSVAFSRRV